MLSHQFRCCACRYFAHLAKASDMSSDFIPPTVSQIRQVNVQLRANQLLPAGQLMELCKGTGVHEGTLRRITADMSCVNTCARNMSVPEVWQRIPLPLICALPVTGWTVLLASRTCSYSLRCRCGPGQDCPARLQPSSCHLWSTLLPQVRDTQFNTCCMPDHYDMSQR